VTSIDLRPATPADAEVIAAIYAHHVLHGTASFDTEPPDLAYWREKIATVTGQGWPFVVGVVAGTVAGYAYATPFRDRPAYAHTCEDSIYVDPAHISQGIGSALLAALIQRARTFGFEQMIAVIGGAEPASAALHAKTGFVEVGRMRAVGRKFGQVLDTLYMQRDLAV
jgi:phosphinothricin acetyltransferase